MMRKFFDSIGALLRNPWVVAVVVAVVVTLFAVWYGAAWSLIVTLPLIYDYYVGHHLRDLHRRMMERYRWWRWLYAVWCAAIFALVVGVLVHMLLFRWNILFIISYCVVLCYALWNEFRGETRLYTWLYGWVHAILFATVFASIIQLYWFQLFVIPTGSMESTLLAGDYILVSKTAYGPRVPMTPLSFPFVHNTLPLNNEKSSFATCWQRNYRRLAGQQRVERGDVVVFNFPEGDTVVLERAAESYYELLRSGEFGPTPEASRKALAERGTLVVRPTDKKENYIKRCVAVAGDTLRIVDGVVYTNGEVERYIPKRQYIYYNRLTGKPLKMGYNRQYGVATEQAVTDAEMAQYADTTRYLPMKIGDMLTGGSLIPHLPEGATSRWTLDNFGPVWIPRAGATVELTAETVALYGRCIEVYEGNDLELRDGIYYVNGEACDSYTFLQDYYFMMGDNRHGSLDSRFWGFVPEDHIVGKATYVLFSTDPMGGVRWDRAFTKIE